MTTIGNNPINDQYLLYPKRDTQGVENPTYTPTVNEPNYKLGGDFGTHVGVSGVEPTGGVYGVGRTTPMEFTVQGISGESISYANSKGHVGLTEMDPGAGSHYDPLLGHANHKTWLVA